MAELPGRKTFRVFGQEFMVDERYTVTKELGQGAYGIVWYGSFFEASSSAADSSRLGLIVRQRGAKQPDR